MHSTLNKIAHRLTQWRLQPIRVFCFHQTSEQFEADVYCKPDWVPTAYLKQFIEGLQEEGYEFISLIDAHKHLEKDIYRRRKYAVLTADDGLQCQLALVPWLELRNIPITLFVNLDTLDGETCGCEMKRYFGIEDKQTEIEHARKLYITRHELISLSPMVSIGMHGVTHEPIYQLMDVEFIEAVDTCIKELKDNPNYVPFYAYAYGRRTAKSNDLLRGKNIIPVYADGQCNYNDSSVIHREILEYIYNSQNGGDK